jgi:hypothetical protein
MDPKPETPEKKQILSPFQWWVSASALFALVIVPITIAAFYMLNLTHRVIDYPLQYNAVAGILIGLLISGVVGYFYSGSARKHAE